MLCTYPFVFISRVNFTQNYTDVDTAWKFVKLANGNFHIMNLSRTSGPGFLSIRSSDGKLYVPDAKQESNAQNREWRLTPDPMGGSGSASTAPAPASAAPVASSGGREDK